MPTSPTYYECSQIFNNKTKQYFTCDSGCCFGNSCSNDWSNCDTSLSAGDIFLLVFAIIIVILTVGFLLFMIGQLVYICIQKCRHNDKK